MAATHPSGSNGRIHGSKSTSEAGRALPRCWNTYRCPGPYRSLFNTAREGLIIFGPDGRTVDVNQAFTDLSGYSRNELLEMSATDLCGTPEDVAKLLETLKTTPVITHAVELRLKDGTLLSGYCSITASLDEAGDIVFFCGALHSIRELKTEVETLKASEQKYRLLFQQSIDAVALVRPDGLLLDANPALLKLFGFSESEIGNVWASETYVEPAERPRFVERLMSEGGILEDEARLRDRLGTEFDCARTAAVIRRGDGEVLGFQVVHRNVSEQRRAERSLRKSQRDLRRLAARLEETREDERTRIARELHDQVGQALTTMKFDIARIRKATQKGEAATADDLARLEGFVDSTVVDVRRISSELRPGILDDLGLVAAMEWQLDQFRNRTGIECLMDATAAGLPCDSASTALYRVFQELLTNVARHAHATSVLVSFGRADGAWVLTVTDNGRGISPDEVESGKSLGLIGIRERLLPFDGSFEVRGEPGAGTCAVVRMPV